MQMLKTIQCPQINTLIARNYTVFLPDSSFLIEYTKCKNHRPLWGMGDCYRAGQQNNHISASAISELCLYKQCNTKVSLSYKFPICTGILARN